MEVVHGFHAVTAVLSKSPKRSRRLLLLNSRHDRRSHAVVNLAREAGVRVEFVDRPTLDKKTSGSQHQGVALECHDFTPKLERELEEQWVNWNDPLLLILEGVLDPRNLGACLRSAAAAGVDAVLLPKNRTAPLSTVVQTTSSGAMDSLFIVMVSNLARRMKWLREQGVWIIGTADDAPTHYWEQDMKGSLALVMGGEEQGLRRLTREYCDQVIGIPMSPAVESLNVSVATGIVLFEAVRQKRIASLK